MSAQGAMRPFGGTTITFGCTAFGETTPYDDGELRVSLCLSCEGLTIADQCPQPTP